MKRLPILESSDKQYWRSLDEREGASEGNASLLNEFPEGASELPSGVSRRNFLSILGASAALASLAGCRRPEEKILPYARAPEEVVPGNALYFATAFPFAGTAYGLLVESHEGRPTKIEGNPRHPESLGATDLYAQASVLDLYDPDRSQSPLERGQARTWADATAFLVSLGSQLREKKGKGFAVLTDAHRSPTLAKALEKLREVLPEARIFRYEPLSNQNARGGAKIAFGKPLEAILDVAKARVVATFDSDFLGSEGSSVRNARGFAETRKIEENLDTKGLSRLYAVESSMSITGGMADHRLRTKSGEVPGFVFALAHELATTHGVSLGSDLTSALSSAKKTTSDKANAWVKALAKDLAANKGRTLLVAGDRQPASVHAVVHALNVALGNEGSTVRFVQAFDEASDGPESLVELSQAIGAKQVDTLLVLDGNPVFDAPADTGFAKAFGEVETTIHVGTHVDETGAAASWHLNRAHYLEGWGDAVSRDGTASIVQPLIAPLYDGKTSTEAVSLITGVQGSAYELVRFTWNGGLTDVAFEAKWRRALHDGFFEGSAYRSETVEVNGAGIASAVKAYEAPAGDGLELTFAPCVHAYDGRFANNGWLQELPDPVYKVTWANPAWVSPATARKLGVVDGDLLQVGLGEANVTLPVLVAAGQADDSIGLAVGQGRRHVGRIGTGTGDDVYPLRASTGFGIVSGGRASKASGKYDLARTQEHFQMEGRELVREATTEELLADAEVIRKKDVPSPALLSLWHDHEYNGHKWAMTIDLGACTGCGVCVIACQAENNIPIVGHDQVLLSREMHWLRIDRYFEGTEDDPKSLAQPLTCQQCENAPCEQVCPVAATVHSPEGLNDMVYNRCIGTRYCGNNCPYKVRRFNFFNFSGRQMSEQRKMQYNPDVTVRTRGVMEKCTFCVQRINEAKIAAKRDNLPRIPTDTVVSACAQACPTGAITFGDLNDPNSAVAGRQKLSIGYRLLEYLNVRPRITYLAKIRNLNPELESV